MFIVNGSYVTNKIGRKGDSFPSAVLFIITLYTLLFCPLHFRAARPFPACPLYISGSRTFCKNNKFMNGTKINRNFE